jgi:hypothetical protein
MLTDTVFARPFSSAKTAHWSPFRNKALTGTVRASGALHTAGSVITLDLYSHVIPGMQEDAAKMVDLALRAGCDYQSQ